MDFNVISRLESHSKDLFKLGNKRLRPVREETGKPGASKLENVSEEHEDRDGEDRDPRALPPSFASADSKSVDSETQSSGSQLDEDQEFYGSSLAKEEARMKKKKTAGKKSKAHYEDLWGAITRNIGKGFVLGYLGKVAINSLYPILNLVRGRKLGLSQAALLFDAREYGLFWGSMLGIYNGWMYESKKYTDESPFIKHYRGLIAGFLSGLSLVWVPQKKRWPIVLFTLVRAFELQMKHLVRRGIVPHIPNADVLLMSLSSASMLHSWVFHTKTLDPAYSAFLTKQSQMPSIVRASLGNMYRGLPLDLQKLNEARKRIKAATPDVLTNPLNYDSLPGGELLLPNQSLFTYMPRSFMKAMKQALPVYLPVFFVPIILFYPQALLKKPVETLKRVLQGVLRSSVFLSLYVTCGFNSVPVMRMLGFNYTNFGSLSQLTLVIAGIISGLATRIEKKPRRIELALYVMSKAVEGRWNQVVDSGIVRPFKNGDVLVFMASMAVISHTFTRYSSMLRSAYRGVLARFFDTDERHRFYTVPRVISKQLLGDSRNLSHRLLTSLTKRADDDGTDDEDEPEKTQ